MSKWKKDIEELLHINNHFCNGRRLMGSYLLSTMESENISNGRRCEILSRKLGLLLDYLDLEFVSIPEIPASLKLQPRKKNVENKAIHKRRS